MTCLVARTVCFSKRGAVYNKKRILMKIKLTRPNNAPNFYFEVRPVETNDGRSVFVQSDWEYPGIASTFGWSPSQVAHSSCPHDSTDGTVACRACGIKAEKFIAHAYDFLCENEGAIADDPGYFD